MCGFFLANKEIEDPEKVNYFIKFRGPDATNSIQIGDYYISHSILSITGEFKIQPFISEENDIACVYNGQIYNYEDFGSYGSDGECIIPLYKELGKECFKLLDGEFAIALIDFSKSKMYLATDTFATKPLWYKLQDKNISVASYESAILNMGFSNAVKQDANTIITIDLKTNEILETEELYTFSLDQVNGSFDSWIDAFKLSIRKRTRDIRKKLFIGLSSGYDSGAISCELNNQQVPYKAYCVVGKENNLIVHNRFELLNSSSSAEYLNENRMIYRPYINKYVEEFKYRIYSSSSNYNEFSKRIQDDGGSCGLSMVCDYAKRDGHKIYLSGSGADEIFSDYGFNGQKKFHHSNFGGLFPKNLSSIFPWASFYGSTMVSYLAKEEYIAGSYGIETRYPFLDRAVAQEFLSLTQELKNSKYKSVLDEYMTRENYPFEKDSKRGF